MSYIGNQPILNTSEFREEFAVTSTQTVFNTGGFTASSDSATLEVLRNGVLLGSADYTLGSDASTVTLANAAVNGDIIVIKGRRELTNGVQVTERRHEHTIASGETTVTFPYPLTVSQTDVYLNGVKLGSSDFSINSSTRVVSFTINPAVGDLVAIVSREPALTANSSLPVVDAAGNNVLSESGSVVTLTADEANVGSNALVVDSSGNVGVGTSSPNSIGTGVPTIDLKGNNATQSDRSGGLYFTRYDGTGSMFIAHTDGSNVIGGLSTYPTVFKTNNTEAMRIDSSGDVAIGTTVPSAKFNVVEGSNLSESYPHIKIAGSGYQANHWLDGTAYYIGQNSNIRSLRLYSGAETAGVNLPASGTSFGSFSDERLKYDIAPITDGLTKLSNVRCVSYRLKDVDAEDSQKKLGVIAQDLVGLVDEVIDITRRSGDDTEYMSVRYTELIPVLVKAIQEQQTLIESQQSQIDALTARIEALETPAE